jgi:hypothetical protein
MVVVVVVVVVCVCVCAYADVLPRTVSSAKASLEIGPMSIFGYHCPLDHQLHAANRQPRLSKRSDLKDSLHLIHRWFTLPQRSDGRESLAAYIHLAQHSPTFYTLLQAHLVHAYVQPKAIQLNPI